MAQHSVLQVLLAIIAYIAAATGSDSMKVFVCTSVVHLYMLAPLTLLGVQSHYMSKHNLEAL